MMKEKSRLESPEDLERILPLLKGELQKKRPVDVILSGPPPEEGETNGGRPSQAFLIASTIGIGGTITLAMLLYVTNSPMIFDILGWIAVGSSILAVVLAFLKFSLVNKMTSLKNPTGISDQYIALLGAMATIAAITMAMHGKPLPYELRSLMDKTSEFIDKAYKFMDRADKFMETH